MAEETDPEPKDDVWVTMDLVKFPLLKTTHFETYPEEAIALAKKYFRWRCEKENARLNLRRFTEDQLASEVSSHAEMTAICAGALNSPDDEKSHFAWYEFEQFIEQEKIDLNPFKKIKLELNDLLNQAGLQFHLIYHDFHKGISPLKFQFPMFEEEWEQTRSADFDSNESVLSEVRRRPGRPGIDYDWMAKGLLEMEEAEELPPLEGAWRSKIAQILLYKFMKNYDGSKPRKPPKMTTIRDGMRGEFDALQARDEKRYSTR